MKTLLSALAILVLSCTSAHAVTTTFDFLSKTKGYTYGTLDYNVNGIGLSVSAARYKNGEVIDYGKIKQYKNHGLAIKNSSGDNTHEIDGSGYKDVAYFQFDQDVTVKSISFTHNGSNDQFAYFFDTGADGSLNLIDASLDANPANPVADTYNFLASQLRTGSLFGFGALGHDDDFKIASISVHVSAVPLPAGLPLYGAGLALLGFVGWRRKQKMAAAA